jgi:hypothetical protein
MTATRRKSRTAKKGQLHEFSPTEKQRAYLVHLLHGYATGGDVTDRALAEPIKVHATTISHWRENPQFEEWVNAAFDKFLAGGLKKLLVRAFGLAFKGSVKHMEFFAKYSGQAPEAAEPLDRQDDLRNYTVNLLVPRPPALPSGGDEE